MFLFSLSHGHNRGNCSLEKLPASIGRILFKFRVHDPRLDRQVLIIALGGAIIEVEIFDREFWASPCGGAESMVQIPEFNAPIKCLFKPRIWDFSCS